MKVRMLIFALLLTLTNAHCNTWTVFMYMDSSDAMNDVAIKNISDTLSANVPSNVTIAIQLHAIDTTAYRYIIQKNTLTHIQTITLGNDRVHNLIDGANWAFGNYQSDHRMLLFWDHGYGALDPQLNPLTDKWESEPDVQSTANHLDADEILSANYAPCQLRSLNFDHSNHRGYMFSMVPREYLTNNDLIAALDTIYKNLGCKIDIIGFDTCMGAILENCYHCAPYANYLVGVQSCASKDGLNYGGLGEVFDNPAKAPRNITASFVKTFQDYYKSSDVSDIYTLTAIDLARSMHIKELLDQCAQQLFACTEIYGTKTIRKAFRLAHSICYKLCLFPMYTDQYTLLAELNKQLVQLAPSKPLSNLQATLNATCTAIKDAVVAHCCGSALKNMAHGISIYCPDFHSDSSYANTRFGQDSLWGKVLELETAEEKQL